MSHYKTLGVPTGATPAEIESAFQRHKLILVPHDLSEPIRAVEALKRIVTAYRVLRDPVRRKAYDQLLEQQEFPIENDAISDEEFRSWLKQGRVAEGIAAKAEAERVRHQAENTDAEGLSHSGDEGRLIGRLFLIGLAIWGAFALWGWLDDSGYIRHDKLTSVSSTGWSVGEYKDCISYNTKYKEGSSPAALLFCDLSASAEPKIFKVRFYGKTHIEGKSETDSLQWTCKKNSIGGVFDIDAAITCEIRK